MKGKVAISIVVPAYNEEQLIHRCLTTLTNQDFKLPYEIIVVNNNSIDKTEAIAHSFGVTVISETMQSVVAARQRGLIAAHGDIVVGADADCLYPPDWLQTIYAIFANPKVVACGGPAVAEKQPYWAFLIYKWGFALNYLLYRLTGYVFYLGGFNLAFRRELFLKLGGYRTYLDFGGDEWDVIARLRKVGKIVYEPRTSMQISTRRYRVGFLRWFFVHNLYYYFINYTITQILKRPLIHAPPVRNI